MNKILRNATIFTFFFFSFFIADMLSKYYIFDEIAKMNPGQRFSPTDYKVIGTTSLLHTSTTFLDFLNISLSKWANIGISLSIGFIFLIVISLQNSKLSVIGFSIMMAGLIGNTSDNIFHDGVRDIIYTPWLDKGVFNLADVFVIMGLPLAIMGILIGSFKTKK